MATMNDLLYNYQDTNEFVCSDGRMSVNGLCKVDQPDSVDTSNLTNEIIETSKNGGDGGDKVKQKTDLEIALEKDATSEDTLKDIQDEKDIMSNYNTTKPDKFDWSFDKEPEIDNYNNTLNNYVSEYNNLINSYTNTKTKLASSAYTLGTGGSLAGASVPWLLPIFAGGAINKAERERIQNITNQDKQGDIHTIDMMTYDTPQPGDEGFNIHQDKGDQPHGTDTSGDFAGKGSNNPFGI